MTAADIDRNLPTGDEIFLDHVAHFVRDADAAARALTRVGFTPTPQSIQVSPDGSGRVSPTGTGNITAMFERGYTEVLFKTADTSLGREFDGAIARHAGVHLAAFAVADAAKAHARRAASGFAVRELARMQRPVDSDAGPQTAGFTIARVEPGVMPEGRIQILTHHTEQAVWQPHWLSHRNGATGLIDVVVAVADVEEAAERFARFTGRPATKSQRGVFVHLDRGGINIVNRTVVTERLPEVAIAQLPFIAGYALRVNSLAAIEAAVDDADLEWRAIPGGIVAAFPVELGEGAWFFVEDPAALPWRK